LFVFVVIVQQRAKNRTENAEIYQLWEERAMVTSERLGEEVLRETGPGEANELLGS
jgi:hypothetical protein